MLRLRGFLEKHAGSSDLELIIPHPFLPPRYLKLAEKRNLAMRLTSNFQSCFFWEGSNLAIEPPPTPAECRRLVREALSRLTKYRRDLKTFSTFVDRVSELPDLTIRKEEVAEQMKRAAPIPKTCGGINTDPRMSAGGETPLPDLDYECLPEKA